MNISNITLIIIGDWSNAKIVLSSSYHHHHHYYYYYYGGICEVSTQFSHFYIYVAALLMQSSLIFIQYSAKVVDIFRMISLCVWCDFLSWRESSWEWGLTFINLISYFTNRHTCVLFTLEISRGPFKLISLTNCAWHGPLTSVRFTFSQFRCAIKNNHFKGL